MNPEFTTMIVNLLAALLALAGIVAMYLLEPPFKAWLEKRGLLDDYELFRQRVQEVVGYVEQHSSRVLYSCSTIFLLKKNFTCYMPYLAMQDDESAGP